MNNKSHDELKKAFALECVKKGKTPYYIESVRNIMDSFEEGGRDKVSLSEIVEGDALTFDGNMKSMLCPPDTNSSFLHFYEINVKDVIYDWSTGQFAIVTNDSILTNIDFSEELRLATSHALINEDYYELSKMMNAFYDKTSINDVKRYLEVNQETLGLSDTQLNKLKWNPINLKKIATGLMIAHQCEGASNGVDELKKSHEIDKTNEFYVVSSILQSIKGLHYTPPEIDEHELELEREMTPYAKALNKVNEALANRAEATGKSLIMICDVSHTRFENNNKNGLSIRPKEIEIGMDLGICGKLQDMKTQEELPGYADCIVEYVLAEVDNLPFDLLVIESDDTIYVGFGPEREIERVKRTQSEQVQEREDEQERDTDDGIIQPRDEEYPAPTKDDEFIIPPYPVPERLFPDYITTTPEPEHDDEFEITM